MATKKQASKPAAKPSAFEVVEADYAGVDVTAAANKLIKRGWLASVCLPTSFGIDDPSPGFPKTLIVKYRTGTQVTTASFGDGQDIALPQ